MFAAFGTVAALFDRERSGKGQHVDVAMLDSMMAMQLTGLARQLYKDETPKPAGNRHPVTYPVDSFTTRDGDIVLVCFSDKLFAGLGELMGIPGLAEDPRFANNTARNENETALYGMISDWAATQSQKDAIDGLLSKGIPAAPIWDLKQLTSSDHVAARDLVVTGQHGKLGDVPLVPQPVKFSNHTDQPDFQSPTLGQHTEDVLQDIAGLDDDEITALKAAKSI